MNIAAFTNRLTVGEDGVVAERNPRLHPLVAVVLVLAAIVLVLIVLGVLLMVVMGGSMMGRGMMGGVHMSGPALLAATSPATRPGA
jgi:hypothetical protein